MCEKASEDDGRSARIEVFVGRLRVFAPGYPNNVRDGAAERDGRSEYLFGRWYDGYELSSPL